MSLGMDKPIPENSDLVKNSVLYKEFLAEREEILKHKWIESEKAGHDIGFEKALAGLDRQTPLRLARETPAVRAARSPPEHPLPDTSPLKAISTQFPLTRSREAEKEAK